MLLAVDIGNTNIHIGIYKGKTLLKNWRVKTDRKKTVGHYRKEITSKLGGAKIQGAIISSVVPSLTHVFKKFLKKSFNLKKNPVVVSSKLETGIKILYDKPEEVGADRIANAAGGFKIYGGPLIIVDFGTATTFDVISEKGEYLGGIIAPGLGISRDALYEKTAKLPKVKLLLPGKVIGKNTVQSIKAGIFYGFSGVVKEIISKVKKETGKNFKVVATGGWVKFFSKEKTLFDVVNSNLTLEGLKLIWENRQGQ